MIKPFSQLLLAAVSACCASLALAQAYPEKPIHVVVPFGAGSSTDTLARAVTTAMSEEIGKAIVVDNKPGAEGFIGVQAVQTAAADGYTLLLTSSSTHVLNVHLYKTLPYDAIKDFAPISTLGIIPLALNTKTGSPFTSVQTVIDAARKQPGKITFGSATASMRLSGEMFQQKTGVNLLNVPYKSVAAAVTDLLGGQIDLVFVDSTSVGAQVKAGTVKVLGVTTQKRNPSMPNVPTIEEAGVPGYDFSAWFGVYAPARTPTAIVNRLHAVITKAMSAKQVQNVMDFGGMQTVTLGPDAFRAFNIAEIDKLGALIKAAGIEAK